MSVRVQVEVHGPAELLRPFRTRANALLDEQFDDRYAEHHTADKLEYRLVARQGIPFPPFVIASEECPELVVNVVWQARSGPQRGAATITAGKVVEYADEGAATDDGVRHHVEAAADGAITLAVALREWQPAAWIGYALSAHQQSYFHCALGDEGMTFRFTDDVASAWARSVELQADGSLRVNACPEAIEAPVLNALDDLSRAFVDGWIWFEAEPELDTALERHRFTQYGLRVYPANLRSERIRRSMTQHDEGYRFGTLDEPAASIIEALNRCWRVGVAPD